MLDLNVTITGVNNLALVRALDEVRKKLNGGLNEAAGDTPFWSFDYAVSGEDKKIPVEVWAWVSQQDWRKSPVGKDNTGYFDEEAVADFYEEVKTRVGHEPSLQEFSSAWWEEAARK